MHLVWIPNKVIIPACYTDHTVSVSLGGVWIPNKMIICLLYEQYVSASLGNGQCAQSFFFVDVAELLYIGGWQFPHVQMSVHSPK